MMALSQDKHSYTAEGQFRVKKKTGHLCEEHVFELQSKELLKCGCSQPAIVAEGLTSVVCLSVFGKCRDDFDFSCFIFAVLLSGAPAGDP